MKNYDTYSELIYLVIDGEASDAERTAFYSALTKSTELQNEFQTAMKFNRAAESYPKKSTVPVAVTDKLFSKAGLTYIPKDAAIGAAAVTKGAIVKSGIFSNVMSNSISKIGFAVIGMILGAGIMYLLNDNSEIIAAGSQPNNIDNRFIKFAEPEKAIPIMSANNVDEISFTKSIKRNKIASNNSGKILTEDVGMEDEKFENIPHLKDISEISNISNSNEYFHNLSKSNINYERFNKMIYENNILNKNNIFTFFDNLEISLENSIPWFVPEASVSPKSYNKFNNLGLRVLFKANDYFRTGISINQSTFFAEFIQSEMDGNIYNYRIQPNLTTVSSEILINLINSEVLVPYIQLSVGANQAGIVLSPAMGIEYNVVNSLSIYFSGTMDYFRFIQNDNWFDTQKFRLNYGINLKF
ncbi:MAG: hypothetical protein KIT33_01735 [Candidatus Kapabacteria bacterium]|nr:hypothetical protein [Ignavibacteriota bacterium]MCW5883672.1 hypothetical protein [Candidatus Kapabacteria bacterium]